MRAEYDVGIYSSASGCCFTAVLSSFSSAATCATCILIPRRGAASWVSSNALVEASGS
jgi:hypothetical protein